jgi:hypothetical protein
MGYYSDISGEVVIVGLFLSELEKYQITTEISGPELEVLCKNERSGFYMEPPEPSGFRVDDDPPTLTLYPRDEPDKAYGFSEFVEAVHRIWRDGHVKSAEMRRIGESGDDVEHYYLWEGKWRIVKSVEKVLNWKPKPCPR